MPALRAVVRPWQTRIQAAHVPSQLLLRVNAQPHSCPALVPPTLMSRFLSSEDRHSLHSPPPQTRSPCQQQKLELLRRKVALLECEQLSPAQVSILSKSKAFNSASFENLGAVLKVLKQFLGSGEKAGQALAMSPGILVQQSELLGQKLTVLAYFGVREKVGRKVCSTPYILSRKLESLHKIVSLLEEIGLSVKARHRLFFSHPTVVRSSGVHMFHAFDFFRSLGMSGKQILGSFEKQPKLLLYSVNHLMERCIFFQQLGFTVEEFVKATCAGLPPLPVGTLQAKIKFLKDQGFSNSDVHLFMLRNPYVFALGHNCLKSKLDFLLCEQNYDIADIMKCPLCLKLSLQDRLIPRLTAVKEKGLFKVYALSTILNKTDVAFQQLASTWK